MTNGNGLVSFFKTYGPVIQTTIVIIGALLTFGYFLFASKADFVQLRSEYDASIKHREQQQAEINYQLHRIDQRLDKLIEIMSRRDKQNGQ